MTRYAWLLPALDGNAVVITASRRLARELAAVVDARRVADGHPAWATPAIHYWQDWLALKLEDADAGDLPEPIEPAAAALLWERSLETTGGHDILSLGGVVRHAQAAHARLADWCVEPADVEQAAASRDERWFARAASAYRERLAAAGWVDGAGLAALCTLRAADAGFRWPANIVHAGFDRPPPSLARLFEHLVARGTTVAAAPRPPGRATLRLVAAADDAAQWRAAGRYAREVHDRDPGARVAIVALDLDTQAARVGRLVREGYAPGWQTGGETWRDAVNVSYGQRLSRYPSVAVALSAIAFAAHGSTGSDVGLLLRSPFLAAADRGGRARADAWLRRHPDRHWTPPELASALAARAEADLPDWSARCRALTELHEERGERRSPADWAGRIDACLADLGWPGDTPPDSDEFQLVNRFRALLNQLARLARVSPRLTLPEASRLLAHLAADTLFQPEADAGSVDVLGVLETAGLEFDHLWVGGLDAERWPPPGHPLALVSRRLQRAAGMPDATPADTLEFAVRTLARLERAAGELHCSFAVSDGEAALAPSPLLDASAVPAPAVDPGWQAARAVGSGRRRPLEPDAVPPVTATDKVHGGAYTVQAMHEEPFAAFATGRLGIETLEPFRPGPGPLERGTLVHAALYNLFESRPSQSDMAAWTDREARSARAVRAAFGRSFARADGVLRQLLELEAARLERLLVTFIDCETGREPFAIEALEQERSLAHGPLRLSLRIDRIDRLADGSLLIADYKSGAARRFLNRDGEPQGVQLSVYARAVDEAVGALAYINIDSREVGYSGAGQGFASGRKKIPPEQWPEKLTAWRQEVDALLARLVAGDIRVNVLQPADAARGHALLSRVEELRRDG